MKLIFGNPGSGKTKALLEMSAKNNIPVLCESQARVERLLVKAEGYGYKIPLPITVNSLGSVKEVYIDDVKRVLEGIFNVNIAGITVNRDDELEVVDLDVK